MEYEKKKRPIVTDTSVIDAVNQAKEQNDVLINAMEIQHAEEIQKKDAELAKLREELAQEKEQHRASGVADSRLRQKLTSQVEEWLG